MSHKTKVVNITPVVPVDSVPEAKESNRAVTVPADSPGPWALKGEAYAIPFRLKPGNLPPGLYHPLDTPPGGPENDDFQGVGTALHSWQLQMLIIFSGTRHDSGRPLFGYSSWTLR